MKKTRTTSIALGLVLVTAVGLGACSSDHSGMSGMSSSTTIAIPANANYNATDIGFAQGMIPHHAQAIEMADLALTNTKNSDVLALALLFGVINLPCVACWAGGGAALRRFLQDPLRLRIFNISMALALLASLYPMLVT